MPFVTVGRREFSRHPIYYEDHGSGSPVVLVHGYALNGLLQRRSPGAAAGSADQAGLRRLGRTVFYAGRLRILPAPDLSSPVASPHAISGPTPRAVGAARVRPGPGVYPAISVELVAGFDCRRYTGRPAGLNCLQHRGSLWAPRLSSRSVSASKVPLMRSRWRRL